MKTYMWEEYIIVFNVQEIKVGRIEEDLKNENFN